MTGPVRAFFQRLRGVLPGASHEALMREELAHDLALMTEDAERGGLTHEEARRQALLQLGGMEQTMQSIRNRRTFPALEELMQDIRFALRQFRRNPGFAITAIVTLALGFGASLAIFAFVDAAIIKPLPFRDPSRLAWVTETADIMRPANLSWPDYQDWLRQTRSFETLAVWRYTVGALRVNDTLQPVQGMFVSANFLQTLGLHPEFGRDFNNSDNAFGAARVVMLTDALWRNSFHADPSIVNRTVEIGGDPYTVIGVLPPGFQFAPRGTVQYVGAVAPRDGNCENRRSCHSLNGVARLRPGITMQQADSDVKNVAASLQRQYPDSNTGQGGIAMPLTEQIVGKIRPVLYVILSAALLLCAIACINVGSLVLARSESRRREFALRSALGASYLRMFRQFAVESTMLVAISAAAGVAAASAFIRALMVLVPQNVQSRMPFFQAVGVNRDGVLFAAAIAITAIVIFTFVPGVRLSAKALQRAIAEGSAAAGAGSLSWRRLGSMLVIAEISVAVVLLVGAGLLSRSLTNLLKTDLAFDPDHLVALSFEFPERRFPQQSERVAFARQLVDRLARLPGVSASGYGALLPVTYNGNTDWIRFPDRPYDGKHIEINERAASSTYFQTLHVRLLKGRSISDQDAVGKPLVAVVNRTFAEKYFPNQDPIGKTFGDTSLTPKSMKTIVGVVDDLHEGALDDPIWPAAYYSVYQEEGNAVVLRVAGDASSIIGEIPKAVHAFDPDVSVSDVGTMNEMIGNSQSAVLRRGAARLAGTFATTALLLCAVGLYGVISYSVSLRNREIGVRMALGADRKSIYSMVLREAGTLSLAGIVVGLLLSAFCMSLLRALLFHVSQWDWRTLTVACSVLVACALGASLAPARRAARGNPMEALRTE